MKTIVLMAFSLSTISISISSLSADLVQPPWPSSNDPSRPLLLAQTVKVCCVKRVVADKGRRIAPMYIERNDYCEKEKKKSS
jgi:hypothetical protein